MKEKSLLFGYPDLKYRGILEQDEIPGKIKQTHTIEKGEDRIFQTLRDWGRK